MSTASDFRRMSREEYLAFKHYFLVSQDEMRIEMYTRNDDNSWRITDHRPSEDVWNEAIGCRLKWDETYARVSFESNKSPEET